VRRIGDVAAFRLPQRTVHEVLSARTGSADGVALRVVELDPSRPGAPRTPHVHDAMEEVVVVLAGRGATWIDGAWHAVSDGDAWAVPAGAAHATLTHGPEPLRLLCFFPSGRPEDDYRELDGVQLDAPPRD
jgi:quercetin dioxygenase-like cupin family protein